MKKLTTITCVLILGLLAIPGLHAQTVLFNQTFSTAFADIGGTVVNTAGSLTDPLYVNATSPSTSQFSAVATSASGNGVSHVSCDGNMMFFGRQGGGSGWAVQDGGAAFGTGVGAVVAKLDFDTLNLIKQSSSSPKVTFVFLLGSMTSTDRTGGPSFTGSGAAGYFTLGAVGLDTFYVVNNSGTATATPTNRYTGKQTITFAVNNTAAAVSYTSPSGSSKSLAANTSDLWVGTTYEGNAANASSSAITGFKFGLGNSGGSNGGATHGCKVDNLNIISLTGSGTGVAGNAALQPGSFSLAQNYPNPFNPATQISYTIPKESYVSLKVYNLMGQEVTALVSGHQTAGTYTVPFDASRLSSGVYLYRLQAGSSIEVKRMMLVK